MLDSDHPRDRLLAILSADGVGYSRLMALDQHRTLTALDAARAVFRTHIEAHGGRAIDMAGDSILAVFESAVSAVKAALAAQAEQAGHLQATPVEQRLTHRIGIHLGEIIEKHDGSVYGDGVNIASRLEGLAPSGGVVVSQAIQEVVVSASSAQAYRNKAVTVQQVGKDLGVRFVLQGNVQRDAEKLRVNVQLADAKSNAQRWSESFDGDGRDLFAFQDRVTTLIGNSMGRELIVHAARDSGAVYANSKLVDLLLQARAMNLKPPSLEGTRTGEALYRQALAIDARNVDARIGLANRLWAEAVNFGPFVDAGVRKAKLGEVGDLLRELSAEGLEDARIYSLKSAVLDGQGDSEGALRAAERVLELEPKRSASYMNLANHLYWHAQPKRALTLLNQAIALDPKNPDHATFVNLCWVEFMLGHYDQAIEWGLRAKAINPNRYVVDDHLAAAYAMKGDLVRAKAIIAAELKVDPKDSISRHLDESDGAYDPAYKAFLTKSLVPALRLAGLPE